MTGAKAAPALRVRAELQLDVEGSGTDLRATLSGDGDRLVLRSEEPGRLWDAVTAAALPAGVGHLGAARGAGLLGEALREAGLRLDVVGPRGRLVSLGTGVDSGVGRVASGSRAVAASSPRALARLLWHRLRQEAQARAGALAFAAALGVGVAAAIVRRRRR